MYTDIANFHEKFGLEHDGKFKKLDQSISQFRINFMQEELDEYIESTKSGNLEGQLDAIIDLVYVALGTAYMQGVTEEAWQKMWDEVQRANMSKVRAIDNNDPRSKRKNSVDIVKPAGWVGPDFSLIIKEHS